jgi:hypothetical protein
MVGGLGRILSFVQSCENPRTPVHSEKIPFVGVCRLFVDGFKVFVGLVLAK